MNRLHAQPSSSAPAPLWWLLFEHLGELREQLTAVEDAAADVDDLEVSRCLHRARHAIELAGNRAARMGRP